MTVLELDLKEDIRRLSTEVLNLKDRILALEERLERLEWRPATERQKEFIADICKTLNIPYPEGFPSKISKQEASDFIDSKLKFYNDARRKGGAAPKPQG
ncbi:MAG: hypothetical protein QXT77_02420 [Candidatus Methanomethylicaceae archaeon]